MVALKAEYGSPNYQARPIFKPIAQNAHASGTAGAKDWTQSIKLNQKTNLLLSVSSIGLQIDCFWYDVVSGGRAGSYGSIVIADTIDVTNPPASARINNNQCIIGYVDGTNNLNFLTIQTNGQDASIVDVYTVNPSQTYTNVKLTQNIRNDYTLVSYVAERTDTGFIELGNINYHADWTIDSITAYTTTIAIGANTVNYQIE